MRPDQVSAVLPDALTPGQATSGLIREIAFDSERAVLIRTRAEGGATSGWHHHGDREVFGYVRRGEARFEFGPGGAGGTHIPEGGFFHIPPRLVHRDVNPLDELQELIIAFAGDGPLVVNVAGPQAV